MTKRKVIALLTMVVMLATTLLGCGAGTTTNSTTAGTQSAVTEAAGAETSAASTGTGKVADIVWVHMSPAAQSEQRAYAGFTAYLKEKGWEWKITEVNSDGSGEKMASNIEDAVAKGCDAIVVSMADLRASSAALKKANDAKIPVFSIDSQYTPGVICDITANNYVMSAKVSSYMIDRLGGTGNIVALTMAEHHGVRKRGEVLTEVIVPENPGIKLLDNHNIDYGNFYADSQKTMEDWLAKYGKTINAVWTGWDEPGMAASNAIKAAGFTRADMFVVGIDGAKDAIDMIANGDPFVATVAQGFEVFGEKCADIIQSIVVEGTPAEKAVTVTTVYVDAPLLTESNLPDANTPAYLTPDFYSK